MSWRKEIGELDSIGISSGLLQKQVLSPQQKFALKILKMDTQELLQCISEQLELNPMLEVMEPWQHQNANEASSEQNITDYSSVFQTTLPPRDCDEDGFFPDITAFGTDISTVYPSLQDHLLLQLHVSNLDVKKTKIAEYIIFDIDDNGYLHSSMKDYADRLGVSIEEISEVLNYLQTFDPPGVFARSLSECLTIQLRQKGYKNSTVYYVVENCLDDLATNKVRAISEKTGCSISDVVKIFDLIRTLEPKPGRGFRSNIEPMYIVPDIKLIQMAGRFEVAPCEDWIPHLSVSDNKEIMTRETLKPDDYSYCRQKVREAAWFISCIAQRKLTVKNVAQFIVDVQKDFFVSGDMNIKPLALKDVSSALNLSESTISRATSGKYLQCAKGVFELKYFFSGKLCGLVEGSTISSREAKNMLKEIVDFEDKTNPLSDSEIAFEMQNLGLCISRRTIAKYRTEMRIPAIGYRKIYS